MRGNNPMFWPKLHILVNNSVNSWWSGTKPSWTRVNFFETVKMRGNNPLKRHILVNISVNSRRIGMKPLWTRNNFLRQSKWGVTTPCFDQNCTFWSITQWILDGVALNLHELGLIFFETVKMRGNNPLKRHILVNISANFWHILHKIYTRLNFMRQWRWGPGNYVLTDLHQSVGYSLLITLFF